MSLGRVIAVSVERIVEPVEGMHRAIAGRWFSAIGSTARPVERVHDTIAAGVYSSIRVAGTAVGTGLDLALTTRSTRADAVQAFTNGLWGDRLGRHQAALGISMAIRDRDGTALTIPSGLADAFPQPTGHLVVLVHGLVNTERVWRKTDAGDGLFERLEAAPGLTPVVLRYNSGQSVPANGDQLARLIGTVHRHWPVPVESISLVGHSMGGLVIRGACTAAEARNAAWLDAVSNVVTLGSPHLGTPLEKFVNAVASGLDIATETRPLAHFLNRRSQGIKDLRFGTTARPGWQDVEPESLLVEAGPVEPLPEGIAHHFVAGVVTADQNHPVGLVMGDMLVRADSATGGDQLDPTEVAIVGGVRHSDLVRADAVVEQILHWVTPAS